MGNYLLDTPRPASPFLGALHLQSPGIDRDNPIYTEFKCATIGKKFVSFEFAERRRNESCWSNVCIEERIIF